MQNSFFGLRSTGNDKINPFMILVLVDKGMAGKKEATELRKLLGKEASAYKRTIRMVAQGLAGHFEAETLRKALQRF
jgi:hypothetical protein